MAKRELKTSDLKESAAGVSGFSEPEQRNGAAGVSVIHSSSPRGGMDENTGEASMSIVTASAPTSAKASAWAAAMGRVNHYIKNGSVGIPTFQIKTNSHIGPGAAAGYSQIQTTTGWSWPDRRQMLHDGNSEALQFGLIADTRLRENLGRVNRTK